MRMRQRERRRGGWIQRQEGLEQEMRREEEEDLGRKVGRGEEGGEGQRRQR